ncbi:MAG: response regulator transcription factor [Opitutaceae bacterium]|nr:response regulator transcription factor [Opitutaceae bacterium]
MKALLIDDEPLARAEMRRLLRAHPEIEIVGEAADADEARAAIKRSAPELLFLDVQIPEESGFDLLASLGNGVPPVIFTTAFDQHAVRAFQFGALDYLVKPVEPERLATALQRLRRLPSTPAGPDDSDGTCYAPTARLQPAEKVFVRNGDRCWFVPVESIRGLESDGNSVRLWLADATPTVNRTLAQLEERLPPENFFRANRAQILNLSCIEQVEPWFSDTLKVTLTGGRTIELSRRQTRLFRQRLAL